MKTPLQLAQDKEKAAKIEMNNNPSDKTLQQKYQESVQAADQAKQYQKTSILGALKTAGKAFRLQVLVLSVQRKTKTLVQLVQEPHKVRMVYLV